jgi:uncharacterized membrane protein
MIDWSIRLGDILVLLGFGGALLVYASKVGSFTKSIEVMQSEITQLKTVAQRFADVLTTVAVQKNEIDHIRTDVEDLKRGRGYIVEPRS